jgi:hypothetical protein
MFNPQLNRVSFQSVFRDAYFGISAGLQCYLIGIGGAWALSAGNQGEPTSIQGLPDVYGNYGLENMEPPMKNPTIRCPSPD